MVMRRIRFRCSEAADCRDAETCDEARPGYREVLRADDCDVAGRCVCDVAYDVPAKILWAESGRVLLRLDDGPYRLPVSGELVRLALDVE